MMAIFEFEKVIVVDFKLVETNGTVFSFELRTICYGNNLGLELPSESSLVIFDQYKANQQENT